MNVENIHTNNNNRNHIYHYSTDEEEEDMDEHDEEFFTDDDEMSYNDDEIIEQGIPTRQQIHGYKEQHRRSRIKREKYGRNLRRGFSSSRKKSRDYGKDTERNRRNRRPEIRTVRNPGVHRMIEALIILFFFILIFLTQYILRAHLSKDVITVHSTAENENNENDVSVSFLEDSEIPSSIPSYLPSIIPSIYPSLFPSYVPSSMPSNSPSNVPSGIPSLYTSSVPSPQQEQQSDLESLSPSSTQSAKPSSFPSVKPTIHPSTKPSVKPSAKPSTKPSSKPTNEPSDKPTKTPTDKPTKTPTDKPTKTPTDKPTKTPTAKPTKTPTDKPTSKPTPKPTTQRPTIKPKVPSWTNQTPNGNNNPSSTTVNEPTPIIKTRRPTPVTSPTPPSPTPPSPVTSPTPPSPTPPSPPNNNPSSTTTVNDPVNDPDPIIKTTRPTAAPAPTAPTTTTTTTIIITGNVVDDDVDDDDGTDDDDYTTLSTVNSPSFPSSSVLTLPPSPSSNNNNIDFQGDEPLDQADDDTIPPIPDDDDNTLNTNTIYDFINAPSPSTTTIFETLTFPPSNNNDLYPDDIQEIELFDDLYTDFDDVVNANNDIPQQGPNNNGVVTQDWKTILTLKSTETLTSYSVSLSSDGRTLAILHTDGISVWKQDQTEEKSYFEEWIQYGPLLKGDFILDGTDLYPWSSIFSSTGDIVVNTQVVLSSDGSEVFFDLALKNQGRCGIFYLDGDDGNNVVWKRKGVPGQYGKSAGGHFYGKSVSYATVQKDRVFVSAWQQELTTTQQSQEGQQAQTQEQAMVYGNTQQEWTQIGQTLQDIDLTVTTTTSTSSIANPTTSTWFGASSDISADGNTIAIASPRYTLKRSFPYRDVPDIGKVQIYTLAPDKNNKNKLTWQPKGQMLLGASQKSYFGITSLSGNGNILTVSTPKPETGDRGYVQIYVYNPQNNQWYEMVKIYAPYSGWHNFGQKVSLSKNGKVLIVGAPLAGYFCVYNYDENSGRWKFKGNKQCIIRSRGRDGRKHFLEYSLAINQDGSRIVIGTPYRHVKVYDFK